MSAIKTRHVREVERAVIEILVEHVADDASTVSFGALLSDDVGDGVTLADGISWLVRRSANWRAIAKARGAS